MYQNSDTIKAAGQKSYDRPAVNKARPSLLEPARVDRNLKQKDRDERYAHALGQQHQEKFNH